MSDDLTAFLEAFDKIPTGTHTGRSGGRGYVLTKSSHANDQAQKLVAHQRGGNDYISLNLYRLGAGVRLRPCEMPAEKVIRFVLDLQIDEAL